MPRVCGTLRPLLAIGLAASAACTSAFRVSTGGSTPSGLPFYLKQMVYRQHTTYEYSWLRVSLSQAPVLAATEGGAEQTGVRTTKTRDVANTSANRVAIDHVQSLVAHLPERSARDMPAAICAIHAAFDTIPRLPADHLRTVVDTSFLRVVGNYVERVPVVDYTEVYYLNATILPFGSNKLSAELAADGTLSKGASEASGGVGEAIGTVASALTGVLPVKEALTARWIPAAGDKKLKAGRDLVPRSAEVCGLADPATRSFRVEVGLESQSATFDFTKDSPTPSTGSTLDRVNVNFTNGVFTARQAEKAADKAADEGISFSGRVQLPTPKK